MHTKQNLNEIFSQLDVDILLFLSIIYSKEIIRRGIILCYYSSIIRILNHLKMIQY